MSESRRRRTPRTDPLASIGKEWRSLRYPYAAVEPLSPDEIALIHSSAMIVLQYVGMRIQDGQARSILRSAGFKVDGASEMVHFDEARLMELVALAATAARFAAGIQPRG